MLLIGSPDHHGKVLAVASPGNFVFLHPEHAIREGKLVVPVQNVSDAFVELEYLKLKYDQPDARLNLMRFQLVGAPMAEDVQKGWDAFDPECMPAELLGTESKSIMSYNPLTRQAARDRLAAERRLERAPMVEATAERIDEPVPLGVFGQPRTSFWREVGIVMGAIAVTVGTKKDHNRS
jgi:hypothetical protein